MKTVFPQHIQSHLVVSRRYARRPATLQDEGVFAQTRPHAWISAVIFTGRVLLRISSTPDSAGKWVGVGLRSGHLEDR
jgi:hypothetical protein